MSMSRRLLLTSVFLFLLFAPLALTLHLMTKEGVAHELAEAEMVLRHNLDLRAAEIEREHQEAQRDMLMAMENPDFRAYFELADYKAGNRYSSDKVLQFTPAQEVLRKRLEIWVTALQRRFPIVETCLIDHTGQEHLRIAGGVVAAAHEFSSDEWDAPFFKASMAAEGGRVLVTEPYMSIDADTWVIAYTSPIVLANGNKPAFYHYELPLEMFQNLLKSGEGGYFQRGERSVMSIPMNRLHALGDERMAIVNAKGLLVADSGQEIVYTLKPERNPSLNPNLPDFLPPEKLEAYLPPVRGLSDDPRLAEVVRDVLKGGTGVITVLRDGKPHWLVYRPLDIFRWGMLSLQAQPEMSRLSWLRETMDPGLAALALGLLLAATAWFWRLLGR